MNWTRWMPAAVVVLAALHLSWLAMPRSPKADKMDLNAFGRLPVQDGGRVKPLDTVARVALTIINSRQRCTDTDGHDVSPMQWMLEAMTVDLRDPKTPFVNYRIFRVDLPQLVQMMGLENRPGSWRYSLAELQPNLEKLEAEANRAGRIHKSKRNLFEQKVVDLSTHYRQFNDIHLWRLAVLPPDDSNSDKWLAPALLKPETLLELAFYTLDKRAKQDGQDLNKLPQKEYFDLVRKEVDHLRERAPREAYQFAAIVSAYQKGNAEAFNNAVEEFRSATSDQVPALELKRVQIETYFNRVSPFYIGMIYFVFTFFFACLGWIMIGSKSDLADAFFRSAAALAAWTFAIQLIALISRMYLMNRWFVFVTNLYSSAVFIALCGAAMGLVIEAIYGRGIGTAISSVIGGAGLLVAYFLDLGMEGDKLEMMQAVLDTNFWLATHVTTVTFGYAATFVAGFIGTAYIFLAAFTNVLTPSLKKTLATLIYGVICFATLLSFVGTILGGIWADYSWGRFWGWDPKENGAMLIVLWNALILHARWAGMVKQHGLAVLAVFGNIVTAWSWFGTNQLGVGLHEYGFSKAVATSMVVFDVLMLAVMVIGLNPKSVKGTNPPDSAPRRKSPADGELARAR